MLTAIIVAAGSSRRMGSDKLFAQIGGRSLIEHTLAAFEQAESVREIIIVSRKDRLEEFKRILRSNKLRAIIAGGEHRQDSVRAGLEQIGNGTKYVAVHDGARPLITSVEIERVFEQARVHGAATLAEPVRDTLKRAGADLSVAGSVDRNQVYAMQTPQIFERAILEQAYREVSRSNSHVTDEVSAVEQIGNKVVLVPSEDFNFKITYEQDLQLAEFVLRERTKQK